MRSPFPPPRGSGSRRFSCLPLLLAAFAVASPVRAGWTDGKAASGVIGQPDFVSKGENQGNMTPVAGGLDLPYGVAVDPATGKIFVADYSNNRVLRYPSLAAYASGTDAEAVLGQENLTSNDAGSGADEMTRPSGVEVDADGNLWVVEDGNNRVMLFENAATIATGSPAVGILGAATVGANGVGNGAGDMRQPQDAAMAADGTLWVADWGNHRILKFTNAATRARENAQDINNNLAPADGVLGQENFGEDGINSGDGADNPLASGFHWPYGICVDGAGNLWVADTINNRVLYFLDAANQSNGADADGVLGAPDFDTKTSFGSGQTRFYSPRGVALSPSGSLWVCEEFNRRAVRFDDAAALALANAADMANLTSADGVLGAPDYGTTNPVNPPTQDRLGNSVAIEVTKFGTVLVCDTLNDRVLCFVPDDDSWLPDTQVGTKASKLKGNNVHNTSGSGQKTTGKSKGGKKKIKFYGDVENDSEFADDFRITGTKGNKFFKAKYFRTTAGKTNITAQVVAAGYLAEAVDPGSREKLLLEVKPKKKAKGVKKKRSFKVTASSEYGTAIDRGKFVAKTTK